MILDPVQPVECDSCGMRETFDMTSCVQRSWDNRHLDAKIKRAGWLVQGERHYCWDCKDEIEANASAEHP